MPSRPMLTTPARSLTRPPRPAIAIGSDSDSTAAEVPVLVSTSCPEITRASERPTIATPSASHTVREPNRRGAPPPRPDRPARGAEPAGPLHLRDERASRAGRRRDAHAVTSAVGGVAGGVG